MNFRNGLPSGAGLKKAKITFPGEWQGFAAWLVQITDVQMRYGQEIAIEFVKESRRRFAITHQEYEFALSLAKKGAK